MAGTPVSAGGLPPALNPDDMGPYDTLSTFGVPDTPAPAAPADSSQGGPGQPAEAAAEQGQERDPGTRFANALAAPSPDLPPAVPAFLDTPTPPVRPGTPVPPAGTESEAVAAAFADLARSTEFERVWSEKLKKSHIIIVCIAASIVPAAAMWLLFRG